MQSRNLVTQPLRVALAGCGRWGSCIAKTLEAMPEFELEWVCDPAVQWSKAKWAPALSDDVCRDVEAVLVATPPEHHVAPALLALRHGRAVFVEKPFTLTSLDANRIHQASGNAIVMVGHLLVFHPLYAHLLEQRASGRLGELRHIHVTRHSPSRGTARCPWWTLAPHDISLLVRMLGKPQHMNTQLASNGRDVIAELSWGELRAHLDYSTSSQDKRRLWRIETTRGALELDETRSLWRFNRQQTPIPTQPSALTLELQHFAACVVGAKPPATGIEDAQSNVELLCWGQRNLSQGVRARACVTLPGGWA